MGSALGAVLVIVVVSFETTHCVDLTGFQLRDLPVSPPSDGIKGVSHYLARCFLLGFLSPNEMKEEILCKKHVVDGSHHHQETEHSLVGNAAHMN